MTALGDGDRMQHPLCDPLRRCFGNQMVVEAVHVIFGKGRDQYRPDW